MGTLCDITRAELEELLDYDPETGIFRWKKAAGRYGRIPAGTIAGRLNAEGYRYLHLKGKDYRASRIAWFMVHGEWPTDQVDHRNVTNADDWIGNLREATGAQNKANSRVYKNNTTGFKGVTLDLSRGDRPGGQYRATVSKDGRQIHIGWFTSAEAAAHARDAVLAEFHGEFARRE